MESFLPVSVTIDKRSLKEFLIVKGHDTRRGSLVACSSSFGLSENLIPFVRLRKSRWVGSSPRSENFSIELRCFAHISWVLSVTRISNPVEVTLKQSDGNSVGSVGIRQWFILLHLPISFQSWEECVVNISSGLMTAMRIWRAIRGHLQVT